MVSSFGMNIYFLTLLFLVGGCYGVMNISIL